MATRGDVELSLSNPQHLRVPLPAAWQHALGEKDETGYGKTARATVLAVPSAALASNAGVLPVARRYNSTAAQLPSSSQDLKRSSLKPNGAPRRSVQLQLNWEDDVADDDPEEGDDNSPRDGKSACASLAHSQTRRSSYQFRKASWRTYKATQQLLEVAFDPTDRMDSVRKRVFPDSAISGTKNLVVLGQRGLPDYLFTDFTFVNTHGRLVEQFQYHEEGYKQVNARNPRKWMFSKSPNPDGGEEEVPPAIFYDCSQKDQEYIGFARLVTLNSHYKELCYAVVRCGMIFAMTEYSHLTFMSAAAFDEWEIQELRTVLVVFLLLRLCAAIGGARSIWRDDAARGPDIVKSSVTRSSHMGSQLSMSSSTTSRASDYATSFESTDLIVRQLRGSECWRAWGCLVIFQLVGVRALLRDLPTWLHPWKANMSYAAWQADHARGYFLGFPNEHLFRVENELGWLTLYALTLLQTLGLTALKARYIHAHHELEEHRFSLLVMLLPSVMTIVINAQGFVRLYHDRRKVYKWLQMKLEEGDFEQQKYACDMLDKLFGVKREPQILESALTYGAIGGHRKHAVSLRCAELVRELQQWKVCKKFRIDLGKRGISARQAELVLHALREIAEDSLLPLEKQRGPVQVDAGDAEEEESDEVLSDPQKVAQLEQATAALAEGGAAAKTWGVDTDPSCRLAAQESRLVELDSFVKQQEVQLQSRDAELAQLRQLLSQHRILHQEDGASREPVV